MLTRTITLAFDRDFRLGRDGLIWGAAEGDDEYAAKADAVDTLSEGDPLQRPRGERLARVLVPVRVEWPVGRPLPTGQDPEAIRLAERACGIDDDS